jgi:hypothetical protein
MRITRHVAPTRRAEARSEGGSLQRWRMPRIPLAGRLALPVPPKHLRGGAEDPEQEKSNETVEEGRPRTPYVGVMRLIEHGHDWPYTALATTGTAPGH